MKFSHNEYHHRRVSYSTDSILLGKTTNTRKFGKTKNTRKHQRRKKEREKTLSILRKKYFACQETHRI